MILTARALRVTQVLSVHRIINILGWVGVVLGLGAYTLVIFRVLPPTDYWYLLLNVIGSTFLVIEWREKKDWQSVVVNLIVGGFALVNFLVLVMR